MATLTTARVLQQTSKPSKPHDSYSSVFTRCEFVRKRFLSQFRGDWDFVSAAIRRRPGDGLPYLSVGTLSGDRGRIPAYFDALQVRAHKAALETSTP